MSLRLGVLLDDLSLNGAKLDDPVEVVVIRSTFLNPPRAAAAKRQAEKIRELHRNAELIPYAWHYVTHEHDDGIDPGSNRALETTGKFGHFRSTPDVAQAWEISTICAQAFGANKLIVRTPTSFSPGALSRKRMTEFVEAHTNANLSLLWEPSGLWSVEAAVAFAEPLGIEVIGPALGLTGQVLDFEDARWLRVPGGKDGRLRASQAESLAVAIAELGLLEDDAEDEAEPEDESDPITLLFDGPRAHANLRAFFRTLELV
jgi:hypothetical protein